MVTWASSGKFPNAAFLCICVDSDAFATAKEFAQLYFGYAPTTLINGYIDSRPDFPNFQAQLGCQGFIIFNSTHELVTTKTIPFNEYRARAFHDVEGKLLPLLQETAPQNFDADMEGDHEPANKQDNLDVKRCLRKVTAVGHDAMDAQHDVCISALVDLAEQLTVKQLQVVQQKLQTHFDEEETLLQKYGFGTAISGGDHTEDANTFSAFGSHVKDHKRILALADDAARKLHNVCDQSDAMGGTVPRAVAEELCRAFADHATMFDSLYEGKLVHQTVKNKVVGWYNFQWRGGSFPVCFRPTGDFFCPQFQALATWTMVEDLVKIDWGKFGNYELTFDESDRRMTGNEVPKDESNQSNWRNAQFLHDLSEVEKVLFGAGAGTEWELEWKDGKFPIKFKPDGFNSFECETYPALAHWSTEGNDVTIHWGQYGTYKLSVNPMTKTMEGGELGGDQSKDSWWRKASFSRNL